MSQTQSTTTNQTTTTTTITPIDTKLIVENGESPTAIILAVAILISVLFHSMTGFAKVIVMAVFRQKKK
jgi:hypothetical protein